MSIIALDLGLKRLGVAICFDKKTSLVLDPILRKNRNQAARDLSLLLAQKTCTTLVVGMPKGGSSFEEMKRRIEHFVGLLDFGGEIVFQDEYGTSLEAKELIKGVFKDKKNGKLDSLSAKIILDRYLEKLRSSTK